MNNYKWIQKGDINAFFALMLDNVTQLVILASILIGVFGFPKEIVYMRMIPGTAMGILAGNLLFTYLAFRLAKKTGRSDITAMPLGIDTVSLFGFTFGIYVPVWLATNDAELTWHVGTATVVITGIIKMLLSYSSGWIKKIFPQAALLGSIAGIALLLIAFLPTITLFASPIVGFISLSIIFLTFFTRRHNIIGLPGSVWAVIIGVTIYYVLRNIDASLVGSQISSHIMPGFHLPLPFIGSLEAYSKAIGYISIILPLSIVNVIGGIDVTESAEAAGDPYDVRDIIFTEGFTTFLGGLFGGVLQTTPYIGHPAYKKMGGRAAYTLATGLFIGICGILGLLALIANYLPKEIIMPILIFIGIVITAQAFRQTPANHAPAVAVCFIPSIANLILIMLGQLSINTTLFKGDQLQTFNTLTILANGFIVTSLIWGAAMASMLDEKLNRAAGFLLLGSLFSLFGLMHSPLQHGAWFLPWDIGLNTPLILSASYLMVATMTYIFYILDKSFKFKT